MALCRTSLQQILNQTI